MAQEKKYDVFISYSRKDSVVADKICSAFDQVGITYFIDREGIGGGHEFPLELATAIMNSQIFLLLGSKNSYESKYTNAEIHFAFKKKEHKSILPYLLDDTPMPLEIDFILSTINWRKYQEHPINTVLVDDVLKLLGREQTNEVNTHVDKDASREVPKWIAENCIECNKCSYVCPQSCIRPFVMDENEVRGVQGKIREMKVPTAMKGMFYRIQVGVHDCIGCGKCVYACPGHPRTGKALQMVSIGSQMHEAKNWDYCTNKVKSKRHLADSKNSIKNSQFW